MVNVPSSDRESELKAFDATKGGVKGLVDGGITTVPRIFINPQSNSDKNLKPPTRSSFPVIDMNGIDEDGVRRKLAVEAIGEAASTWGFFQLVNHGIADSVLQEMVDGCKRFFEQDDHERRKWYTRDLSKTVVYNSNFDLYSAPFANWRDTVYCEMAPRFPSPHELPTVCRDIMLEYTKHVLRLGQNLFEMLSESLGLKADHLGDMKCGEGLAIMLHYYPVCPQPELTMGTSQHADSDFLTVLLNDQVDGLQVLYQNEWVDVPPVPGALVVNIGDLLQLVSNDRFISAEHRVVANKDRPRVSIACFFRDDLNASSKLYGPIEELLSEDNPARFRATTVKEYVDHFNTKGLDGTSALSRFRI